MSRPRFSFFDPPADILQHSDSIRISLMQIRGKLAISFRISGGYFPDIDDDDDCDTLAVEQQPDPAELARTLLGQFIAAKANQGGDQ